MAQDLLHQFGGLLGGDLGKPAPAVSDLHDKQAGQPIEDFPRRRATRSPWRQDDREIAILWSAETWELAPWGQSSDVELSPLRSKVLHVIHSVSRVIAPVKVSSGALTPTSRRGTATTMCRQGVAESLVVLVTCRGVAM